MRKIRDYMVSPEVTKVIRFMLDELLPPIVRDQRWFFGPIIKLFNGRLDIDFKRKAVFMTEEQFRNAYESVANSRQTDTTTKVAEWVLANLAGNTILEAGCGNGDLAIACAAKGHKVLATDLAESNLKEVRIKAGRKNLNIETRFTNIEQLPFENNSFDTTLCLHTLEHVKNLCGAINELKRVTKKRLIVVVPKQRYYRYTCDYHINFFGDPEQIILAMKMEKAQCYIIDGSLCYIGEHH